MSISHNIASENLEKHKCPVLFGFNKNGKTKLIYCAQWSCPNCKKRLAKRWAVRIKLHLEKDVAENELPWFCLTLTLSGKYKDVPSAYRNLRKLWDRLRQSINRSGGGRKWQYAAFCEGQPHRKFMPHFHIVMDCLPPARRNKRGEITQHNLHDFAIHMGWGHQVKLREVTSDRAAWYCAKYVSKGSDMIPKGFRRVRVSQGWTKLPVDPARKLIVIKRGESVLNYILRVSELTGTEHSELVNSYFKAKHELELANLDKE